MKHYPSKILQKILLLGSFIKTGEGRPHSKHRLCSYSQVVSLWDWAVPLWVSHPSAPGRLHKGRGKLSLVKESVLA